MSATGRRSCSGHVTRRVAFQVCHVVLGLRPRTRLEEADIVLGWLCRQESIGYRVGTLWYLVNMTWWNAWTDYVNYQVSTVAKLGRWKTAELNIECRQCGGFSLVMYSEMRHVWNGPWAEN